MQHQIRKTNVDILGDTLTSQTIGNHSQSPETHHGGGRIQFVAAMLFWSLTCGLVCLYMLTQFRGWDFTSQTFFVAAIFGGGAALGFWPAIFAARGLLRRPSASRVLLIALSLTLWTLFMTSCLFALQYRAYFAQWHGEAFSRLWLWQQFFTAGGAVYTYVVLGLRLYVPVALFALFATSWWVNRLPR